MQQPVSQADLTADQPAQLHQEHPPELMAELMLDSHRVVGEAAKCGTHRRLVDALNNSESPSIFVQNGELDDPTREDDEPRRFDVMHVFRDAILFLVPRGGAAPEADHDPFAAITKVPVPVTVVLPGFEIRGTGYVLPESDPTVPPMLHGRRFVPLTDATIIAVQGRTKVRKEPLVVVNMARALVYAPKDPRPG